MLPLEFDSQMNRLRDTYTGNPYPRERTTLIWNAFKRLPDGMFERVVDFLIANHRQPPMQNDFAEAASKIACERRSMDSVIKRIHCKDCDGYGYYVCRNDDGRSMTGSCPRCAAGVELRTREIHPISDVRDVIRMGYKELKKVSSSEPGDPVWVSSQAPGMPAAVECLCVHIKAGTTSSKAFRFGLRYTKLSEPEMWEIYEAWMRGEVHPLARRHFSLKDSLLDNMPMNKLDWKAERKPLAL